MASTSHSPKIPHHQPHRCPSWLGWILASPIRRWFENPEGLLSPLVDSGHRVLEIGPGMGFFTIPLAERVGPNGKVYCVDVQQAMLTELERRLQRRGLSQQVEARCCTETELGVSDLIGSIDLAVLIHVLHEVDDPTRALRDVVSTLGPKGQLLLIEPKGHVKAELFETELEMARNLGMVKSGQSSSLTGYRGLVALLSRAEQ